MEATDYCSYELSKALKNKQKSFLNILKIFNFLKKLFYDMIPT